MRLPRLLSALPIASALLLSGCSQDAEINNLVSSSTEAWRDCDRVAMKVLLASYEQAGNNQGRFHSFNSNSGIPVKGPLAHHPAYSVSQEGDSWVWRVNGDQLRYNRVYYVDDDGKPKVYRGEVSSDLMSNDKYFDWSDDSRNRYETPLIGMWASSEDDYRKKSQTANSITCRVLFRGEGAPGSAALLITEDKEGIYWRKD